MDDQELVNETFKMNWDKRTYFLSPYLNTKMIRENIRNVYKIGRGLGTGQFGIVRVGSPYSDPKLKYAIKSVRREASEDYIRQLEKEFRILNDVDHPNIVKFYDAYQDQKFFHFVFEYCEGGEVFDRLSSLGAIYEADASSIIRELWYAIQHLHENDICHRDLKPENILFKSKNPDSEIKLIDFGLSTYAKKDRKMKTRVGSPLYVAPEVLKGSYQKSCDMWSIGVIAYVILWGYPPFDGKSNESIYRRIEKWAFTYPTREWRRISPAAKDFINKLLVNDPEKRMNPYEALQHIWITKHDKSHKLEVEIIKKINSVQPPIDVQADLLQLDSNL